MQLPKSGMDANVAKFEDGALYEAFTAARVGIDLLQPGTGLLTQSLQIGLHGGDAGCSKGTGTSEPELAGEGLQSTIEHGQNVADAMVARIATDFDEGTRDANGSELLEEISVAEDDALGGGGLVARFVGLNGECDGGKLFLGKFPLAQEAISGGECVGNMIPLRQFVRVGGTVAGEDAEIVHPRGSNQYIKVRGMIEFGRVGQHSDERGKPGLMAEFIDGQGFCADVLAHALSPFCGDFIVNLHCSSCPAALL